MKVQSCVLFCFELLVSLFILKLFSGIVVDIKINESVTPVSQRYRRLPIHCEDDVDRQLDELLAKDIIEKVNEPSRWVSCLTLAVKNDGTYRMCVDMREANKAVIREKHPLPTFEDICPMLEGSDTFSTLDIKNAFHQVEISEQSRHITTFICKKGLMRFKRLIFGICNAPEIFQKILEQMLAGSEGVANFMDDIIIFGKGVEDHDRKLNAVLKILEDFGVLLNDKKCVFRQSKLIFMGHWISKDGISPCESSIDTLNKFRLPATKEELDSFLGFVQYHGRFIKNLASMMDPLRELSKRCQSKKSAVDWNPTSQKQFWDIKDSLKTEKVLGYFSKVDKTIVEVDASPVGLGAILSQKNRDGVERVIMFISKTLTDIERRYSQTEREALAIVWAIERLQYFLLGCEFILITDHKPLVFMFQPRAKPCARIERWILRLQAFRYKIQYKQGSLNWADALSRTAATEKNPVAFDEEAQHFVLRIIEDNPTKAVTQNEIREANESDKQFKEISSALVSGNWSDSVKQWRFLSGEFSVDDKMLLRGDRIYIPEILRERVIKAAHEGHFGRSKMLENLRSCVWWPSLSKDVEKLVMQCKSCLMVSKPDKAIPMKMRDLPDGPGQDYGYDFISAGKYKKQILVGVDYYSRYTHLSIQSGTTADETIRNMQITFALFGWPKSITCDNGPPFNSHDFNEFCDTYNIKIFFTPPRYAQANGLVERMNANIKKRIMISWAEDSKDWQYDLLVTFLSAYHSSAHSTLGKTPFELMFGRKMKTKLPSLAIDYHGVDEDVRDKHMLEKQKMKDYADERRNAKDSEIDVGDTVLLRNDQKAHKYVPNFGPEEFVVKEKKGDGDCIIQSGSKEARRQITFLKKLNQPSTSTSTATSSGPAHLPSSSDHLQPSASSHQDSTSTGLSSQDISQSPLNTEPREVEESSEHSSPEAPRPKRSRTEPAKFKDYVKRVQKH